MGGRVKRKLSAALSGDQGTAVPDAAEDQARLFTNESKQGVYLLVLI